MPPPAPLQSFPRRPGEGAGKAAEAEEEEEEEAAPEKEAGPEHEDARGDDPGFL